MPIPGKRWNSIKMMHALSHADGHHRQRIFIVNFYLIFDDSTLNHFYLSLSLFDVVWGWAHPEEQLMAYTRSHYIDAANYIYIPWQNGALIDLHQIEIHEIKWKWWTAFNWKHGTSATSLRPKWIEFISSNELCSMPFHRWSRAWKS